MPYYILQRNNYIRSINARMNEANFSTFFAQHNANDLGVQC